MLFMRKILYFCIFILSNCIPCYADVIDLLMVYDNSSLSWLKNNGGMSSYSFEAVNRLNQAFRNSGIDVEFRCVKYLSIDYDYAGSLSGTLMALDDGEGVFQRVHEERDANGADLVAMFVDTGSAYGTTGNSYLLTNWNGRPDIGFSVCSVRAVAISDTLVHEIGHNLGADHSKFQTIHPGPNEYLDNEYSAGWYFSGSSSGRNYHTIMAYNFDGYGNSYTPCGLFSSPVILYDSAYAGNYADGDNSRLIKKTQSVVSQYRKPKVFANISHIKLLILDK